MTLLLPETALSWFLLSESFLYSSGHSFQFSASSLNVEATKFFTAEWKHPHLSRKASCLTPEDLTHSAASHCNWCTTGTVPCQEEYVTCSWIYRCSRSLCGVAAWLNSTSLDFHLSRFESSSSPTFNFLFFLFWGCIFSSECCTFS